MSSIGPGSAGLKDLPSAKTADELFEQLPHEPDVRAILMEVFHPLAARLARRYQDRGEPLSDLVQVACLGLLKAIDRFDPARGIKFSSYATPKILGELKRHFRDRTWAMHVPRRIQEDALRLRSIVSDLCQELGRFPTITEVSERSGFTEEYSTAALRALNARTGPSLDDDSNAYEIQASTDQAAEFDVAERRATLDPHLRKLSENEQRVIRLRYFEDRTQSRIADEVGISQMQVSRLLSRILAQLRASMSDA